jgi:hypothetical protein
MCEARSGYTLRTVYDKLDELARKSPGAAIGAGIMMMCPGGMAQTPVQGGGGKVPKFYPKCGKKLALAFVLTIHLSFLVSPVNRPPERRIGCSEAIKDAVLNV